MYWERNIADIRDSIQVMLEEVDLDPSVVPSEMISIMEVKVIDNIIEVLEPVLYHNDNDTPMYGAIKEGCGGAKKVMGEMSSLLTGNGLCDLLCEQAQESNFKCTIRATHEYTGKYPWDEYDTTAEKTSDENDTIIDTDDYQS